MDKSQALSSKLQEEKTLFEKSKLGKHGASLPKSGFGLKAVFEAIPAELKRESALELPELSEPELIRHFVGLSRKNFSIDTHFYPLGSCTMKYNPKINEDHARLPGFAWAHPYQSEKTVQGILQLYYELANDLCEIAGMDEFTLQPAAGAHGELCGMMIVRAYHRSKGELQRTKVIVPDSSHGTNPATAALNGFQVVTVPSNERGRVDVEALKKLVDRETACLMLTNPNTLGLFEDDILKIRDIMHNAGALVYYDGANLNALLGIARPGDMGFDIVHINLHKTFTTPHGGGGPGSGPVGVKKHLAEFLPIPFVKKEKDQFVWSHDKAKTVGKLKSFYGNIGMLIRAFTYIRIVGLDGLKQISRDAILNANYLRKKLEKIIDIPVNEFCMHEFVATARKFKTANIHAGDIGKRMLDYGIHAPTVHFPLVVEDALMIEPTETESKETLDRLVDVMSAIIKEAVENPEAIRTAPHTLPIQRPDEVLAARKPILSWRDYLIEMKHAGQ